MGAGIAAEDAVFAAAAEEFLVLFLLAALLVAGAVVADMEDHVENTYGYDHGHHGGLSVGVIENLDKGRERPGGFGLVHLESSGETVKIFVVRKDKSLTEDDLRLHCRRYLTGYKVPKIIEFRDELPKSNVGKILRRELRDEEKHKTDVQPVA